MNIEGIVILCVVAILLVAIGVVWSIFFAMSHFAERLAWVEKDIQNLKDRLPPRLPPV
jgi:predicted membrane metal-binding protein